MKKAMIECDMCKKVFEEKITTFATIFINKNGMPTERADVCEKCLEKMFVLKTDNKTEEGGAGK